MTSTTEKLTSLSEIKEDNQQTLKYEVERLRLENASLEAKLETMQRLLDKFYDSNDFQQKNSEIQSTIVNDSVHDTLTNDPDTQLTKGGSFENELDKLENEEDDSEIKDLIKQAKQKLKIRYSNSKKGK